MGDPGVAVGTYATALWMIGRAQAIPDLAARQLDLGALEREVRVAQARAVRSPLSLAARMTSSGAIQADVTALVVTAPVATPKLPGAARWRHTTSVATRQSTRSTCGGQQTRRSQR